MKVLSTFESTFESDCTYPTKVFSSLSKVMGLSALSGLSSLSKVLKVPKVERAAGTAFAGVAK
jgi:hypothetical protein